MARNRVGTPKFYIDAMLLARQWGMIETENTQGLFYLNPTKTKNMSFVECENTLHTSITFKNRLYINSLSHIFYLGHSMFSSDIAIRLKAQTGEDQEPYFSGDTYSDCILVDVNGWNKREFSAIENIDYHTLTAVFGRDVEATPSFNLGEISVGWSYAMPHSPDLELTQTFSNESLKTQTTVGGHSLSNVGWSQPPKWGDLPAWRLGASFVAYPMRRSWNLKFSYLSDTDIMPQYYNEIDSGSNNRGIFERTGTIADPTPDDGVDDSEDMFSIKDDFLSKVMPTINLGLPFIFQPNQEAQEFAICKVDNDSISFNMVANNVYDISINLVEVW